MNETSDLPQPEPVPEASVAPPPPPSPPARASALSWLNAVGFAVLAAAVIFLWLRPAVGPDARVDVMAQQLTDLDSRVARLEQRPVAAQVDVAPLTARVAALEQRLASVSAAGAPQPAPAPDLAPLIARVNALEKVPPVNLAPLDSRLASLEARQAADTQLAARVDALAARDDALSGGLRSQQADVGRRLDADEARLNTIERNASQVASLADKANRMARVQAAQAALNAGEKLGEIPGAPSSVTRFATTAPPTLASLRLAFPDAARAARAAAQTDTQGMSLTDRIWAQVKDLVTVRKDGHVIVGDPAAAALEQARAALDAGDLAASVAAVATLSGPPAQAMASWQAEARALLDARAALAEMATHA